MCEIKKRKGGRMLETVTETTTNSHTFPPYFYDGDGLRISRTDNLTGLTTYYVWDTENPTGYPQVVEEIENNQVVRRYGYGLFLENVDIWNGSAFERFYVVRDGTNSVRMLLDSTGNVSATYDYDAFGNILSVSNTNPLTIGNPYQFHSEYRDPATGLVYLRARWYDSGDGRFLRADSYEGEQENPMTLNKYTSFNNNPLNLIDPSGNEGIVGPTGDRITELLQGLSISLDEVVRLVIKTAKDNKIPINVFGSLIYSESGFKTTAVGYNWSADKCSILSFDLGLGQYNYKNDTSTDPMTQWGDMLEIMQPVKNLDLVAQILKDKKRYWAVTNKFKPLIPVFQVQTQKWKDTLVGVERFDEWFMAVWAYKTPSDVGHTNAVTWRDGYFKNWPKRLTGKYLQAWQENSK
jgi:RHS repeat-associated protein